MSLKQPPRLSNTPGKPLEGSTVMVDPGHGNYDCGAYGAAEMCIRDRFITSRGTCPKGRSWTGAR